MKLKQMVALCALPFLLHSQNNQLKMDSLSYSLGVMIGNNLKQQGFENISAPDLVEALEDVMLNKAKINPQEASALIQKIMTEKSAKANASVKEDGEKFLAENKKRKEVTTTASGLQYEVITMGTGPKPTAENSVKTHYHGTLINGKVFDSSVERGEPISFPLNGVIKGWTEALQLMPVGSKFRLFIPYQLAYGERGAGADIKPFSALIFEVELLAIE
ncbi:MAG TPA: FKBP-type peptidyl-prolyl cis-trans isomerase [Saprospiraceae bacterium]|nr:FKBP-type peptidyl-prolyl cis-trans isomerase [Saprospiraceae bacterium]